MIINIECIHDSCWYVRLHVVFQRCCVQLAIIDQFLLQAMFDQAAFPLLRSESAGQLWVIIMLALSIVISTSY